MTGIAMSITREEKRMRRILLLNIPAMSRVIAPGTTGAVAKLLPEGGRMAPLEVVTQQTVAKPTPGMRTGTSSRTEGRNPESGRAPGPPVRRVLMRPGSREP